MSSRTPLLRIRMVPLTRMISKTMKAQVKPIVTVPQYEVTLTLTVEEALDLQDHLGGLMSTGTLSALYSVLSSAGISSRRMGGHRTAARTL